GWGSNFMAHRPRRLSDRVGPMATRASRWHHRGRLPSASRPIDREDDARRGGSALRLTRQRAISEFRWSSKLVRSGSPRFEFLDLVKRNQDFVQIARSSGLIQMVASLDEGLIVS